jgi:hypothetical protein
VKAAERCIPIGKFRSTQSRRHLTPRTGLKSSGFAA